MARRILCPTCRRPATWEANPHRPFCSERCRLVDLGNWAAERYRIPGEEIAPEEGGSDGEEKDERTARGIPPFEKGGSGGI
jgi:endogenous inhibitor of DNA gyrase (YacG/DUF329 family)